MKLPKLYAATKTTTTLFVSDSKDKEELRRLGEMYCMEEKPDPGIDISEVTDRKKLPKSWSAEAVLWGSETVDQKILASLPEIAAEDYFDMKKNWKKFCEENKRNVRKAEILSQIHELQDQIQKLKEEME